jgi:hypothetical protein
MAYAFELSRISMVLVPGPAGDVVVYEQPLLHVPQLKPSNPLYRPLQVGGVFSSKPIRKAAALIGKASRYTLRMHARLRMHATLS